MGPGVLLYQCFLSSRLILVGVLGPSRWFPLSGRGWVPTGTLWERVAAMGHSNDPSQRISRFEGVLAWQEVTRDSIRFHSSAPYLAAIPRGRIAPILADRGKRIMFACLGD